MALFSQWYFRSKLAVKFQFAKVIKLFNQNYFVSESTGLYFELEIFWVMRWWNFSYIKVLLTRKMKINLGAIDTRFMVFCIAFGVLLHWYALTCKILVIKLGMHDNNLYVIVNETANKTSVFNLLQTQNLIILGGFAYLVRAHQQNSLIFWLIWN